MNGPAAQLEACGFVLVADGKELRVANRGSYGAAIPVFIVGGIAFILSMNAVALPFALASEEGTQGAITIGLILGALAVAFIAATVFLYKRWRRLADQTVEDALVLSISGGRVYGPGRTPIGDASHVVVSSRVDLFDSSQGMMRIVEAQIGPDTIRVYKTNTKEEVQAVCRLFQAYGTRVH